MTRQGDSYYEHAIAAIADRNYDSAGDAFGRAGWQVLARPRADQDSFDADEKGWVGEEIQSRRESSNAQRLPMREL